MKRLSPIMLGAALALIAPLGGHAQSTPKERATAHADLRDLQGKPVGRATLTQFPDGVLIRAELTGLPPGPHGMHIHAAAKCEPPFKSAGGHFNPGGSHHGLMNSGFHAGDLPNAHVLGNGEAVVEAFTTAVTLDTGKSGLFGSEGTSLVVHAGPDDYKSDPAGNSGDRIACGVITR